MPVVGPRGTMTTAHSRSSCPFMLLLYPQIWIQRSDWPSPDLPSPFCLLPLHQSACSGMLEFCFESAPASAFCKRRNLISSVWEVCMNCLVSDKLVLLQNLPRLKNSVYCMWMKEGMMIDYGRLQALSVDIPEDWNWIQSCITYGCWITAISLVHSSSLHSVLTLGTTEASQYYPHIYLWIEETSWSITWSWQAIASCDLNACISN